MRAMNSRPSKKTDIQRGPFKGMRSAMTKIMESKGFLAAVSLLIAVMAWGVLVASDGTLTWHKVFTDVPVGVTGETTLRTRGYIVMDDVRALVPSVKLTADVAQQSYNRITGSTFNPHFDLADITKQGENELQISFSSLYQDAVVSCEPSSITVNVERYMTRRVPVVLELTGEIGSGLYLDSYKLDPTMLSVSGPQSLVLSVTRAAATLNLGMLSGDRMSDRTALSITLQDSNGNAVVSDKLEVTNATVYTDSIVVDTELIPTREVPLAAKEFVKGEPAQGYELSAIWLGEESLTVAAGEDVIDAIEFLTTDNPLDIDGATQSVSGYARLKRPSGVKNALPAEMAVTAEIREKKIERTLSSVPVDVDGLLADQHASLDHKKVTVQLTGPYSFMKGLQKEDIRLFVDATGLEAGSYVLPVQIRIDNAADFSCALSRPEITVTIQAQ